MITFNTDDVTVYLAAAGAGKTTVLIEKMVELLNVYRPDEIAFVTYTRKGVENGKDRALKANPDITRDDLIHFKTLHALCFRELGLKNDSVITYKHTADFKEKTGVNLSLSDVYEQQTEDDILLAVYDAERGGVSKGVLLEEKIDPERYRYFKKCYEEYKKQNELIDFYDCLLDFKKRNESVGVKVAFIDEAQDLSVLQWEVCQIAFSRCEKVFIGGDDYQTLFSYQGSNPRILISLAERYKTIKLEKSYRLPRAVYGLARKISGTISDKIDKDYKPVKDLDGYFGDIDRDSVVRLIKKDIRDVGFSAYRWYLLFRNNCFIDGVTELLEQQTIPYHTSRGFCVPERELMKIKRYYNFRKKGFGNGEVFKEFCEKYKIEDINDEFIHSELIPTERKYIYLDYVERWGIERLEEMLQAEPSIFLSTVHRVKGGEADNVAVFLDCTRRVDQNALVNIDEELRVLYVACTRAKVGLYLVPSKSRYGLDRLLETVREVA